jgi:D-arabinose 1-dehydrogenase-like Zn-dependent alcohol dehydrogenase
MNSFLPWTYISDKKPKIPLEQKAALFDNYGGPIRIDTFPVPEIEHDELLVSIYFSGVCKMDVQIWQGTFPVSRFLKYNMSV